MPGAQGKLRSDGSTTCVRARPVAVRCVGPHLPSAPGSRPMASGGPTSPPAPTAMGDPSTTRSMGVRASRRYRGPSAWSRAP